MDSDNRTCINLQKGKHRPARKQSTYLIIEVCFFSRFRLSRLETVCKTSSRNTCVTHSMGSDHSAAHLKPFTSPVGYKIYEQKGTNMIITFLDWEKAFDKVQHCRLWIALRRLGIHDTFIEVLKDCYTKASFFVEDENGTSTAKLQSGGIRQGCPLSPYLFVLLMSVVDKDVALNLNTAYQRRNPNKLPVQRISYADDAVLISTNTAAAKDC